MPKIINAYAANDSIADSLKSLGESMFGDQSRQEVYRQTARKSQRENDNVPLLADALSRGDFTAATRHGVMADRKPGDVAGYGQYYGVMKNGAGSEAGTRATMAVPGAHYGSTVAGVHESEANRRAIAHEATDRAAATQLAIAEREQKSRDDQFSRTPEQVEGPDGRIYLRPRSEAMGMPGAENVKLRNARDISAATSAASLEGVKYGVDQKPTTVYDNPERPEILPQSRAVEGGHAGAPMSKDQVIAGVVQRELNGRPQGGGTVPVGSTDAEASPGVPQGYIHPLVQEALGYGKGAAAYQHLQSGAIGQSYDGGRTIDGHPAGPGWTPVDSQHAITQSRTNAQIDSARTPLPAPAAAYPQAAVDAGKTSGGGSIIQHGANATWGLLGGGEVGAGTNRARENLTNLANEARAVVLSTPGRAAVQSQKWANAAIPQPGALGMTGANADQQKNAVISFTQHLRQIYATEQQEVQDLNTPPDQRNKLLSHMAQLKRVIDSYEAPAKGAAPQGSAPQPAAGGDPLSQARDAIAKGAPREAVIKRLQQNGINPEGL